MTALGVYRGLGARIGLGRRLVPDPHNHHANIIPILKVSKTRYQDVKLLYLLKVTQLSWGSNPGQSPKFMFFLLSYPCLQIFSRIS